ncbi:MAG: hypothetical protein JF607_01540 [Burkholderiales bacterium]|jgi:hypothetical protein|nr:hypothetical protein [Burkholderiales bacterium]
MNEEQQAPDVPAEVPLLTAATLNDGAPPSGSASWLRESARVLAFRPPRWDGLEAGPATVAALILAGYLLSFAVQRALMSGEPVLLWRGFLSGWICVAASAWLCWVVARSCKAQGSEAVKPATLFALSCSASLALGMIISAVFLGLRAALGPADDWPSALQWAAWLLPLSWAGLTQLALLWRVTGSRLARGAVLLLMPVPLLLNGWLAPPTFWWSQPAASAEAEAEPEVGLPVTDETIAKQAQLLNAALLGLRPPQPGRVNVYAATYAPNASEDVFMRESAAVAKTMRERFGADGRLVELVANRATSDTLPWATPANLRQAIARMAAVMDRDRDVLFLHLTSHGGRDGKLANDTWPLKTEPVTPDLLKRWLDEAGVRWRVISVSACYSGNWIAPLAGDGTLVMTAADADHTSYGCGRRSELTFFGRAMYVDALQSTWSFTEAHAQARQLIEVREKEAGKSDGYSNPQISEGAGIRGVLQRLADEQRRR